MDKKITEREVMAMVIEGTITDEVKEWAAARIEKIDESNRRAAEKRAAKRAEDEPLIEKIKEFLTDEPITATVIGEYLEVSTQKASALLRKMDLKVTEIKANGRTVKGYAKA